MFNYPDAIIRLKNAFNQHLMLKWLVLDSGVSFENYLRYIMRKLQQKNELEWGEGGG
jgi:DNA anti-recombination protein RmuC